MLNAERLSLLGNRLKTSVLFIFIPICLLTGVIPQGQASTQNENPAQLESNKTIKLNPLPLSHVRLTGGPKRKATADGMAPDET
jgi:hypothetical protein